MTRFAAWPLKVTDMTLPILLGFAGVLSHAAGMFPACSYRKVGGLRFVRIGRFGASFFISNKGN